MKTLQEELIEIEPTRDFLHEVCGCGVFAEITRTSDGFFLGRKQEDIGFNNFLGKPSEIALHRTQTYLDKLSKSNAIQAVRLLAKYGYPFSIAVDCG